MNSNMNSNFTNKVQIAGKNEFHIASYEQNETYITLIMLLFHILSNK